MCDGDAASGGRPARYKCRAQGENATVSLLRLRDIAKNFGAIEALKGIDLDVAPGEVVGLMGDNGAGKSTLVKIIAGNFPPSAGRSRWKARSSTSTARSTRAQVGIEVVYQDLALADNLTAAEKVFLGRELKKGWGPFETLDKTAMIARSAELSRS